MTAHASEIARLPTSLTNRHPRREPAVIGRAGLDRERAPLNPFAPLHHVLGNRAVQRLVHGERGRAPATAVPIQCRLAIGQPDDDYEREAEAVAESVTSAPGRAAPAIARQAKAPGGGSCSSAPSEDDQLAKGEGKGGGDGQVEDETAVMASAAGPRLTPSSGLESRIVARRGGGAPLPVSARREFESRLGHDFGDVRVHTDGEAAELARSLAAEAFTTGTDLYFGAGRFDPSSAVGRRLLAHELTHVVQQRRETRPAEGGDQPVRRIQRYSLIGFPADEAAKMHAAIPIAKAKVLSCDWFWFTSLERVGIYATLATTRYVYKPDMDLCGWTFPMAHHIEVGAPAFRSTCCDLESTLAHEASHVNFFLEGTARKLEKKCFGCSP